MTELNPKVSRAGRAPQCHPVFVDRKAEVLRLQTAIRRRESMVICGPAGVGKTALLMQLLKRLPADVSPSTFYLSGVYGLRPFLFSLLRELHQCQDPTLQLQLRREGVPQDSFRAWLRKQPASRLKGALYRAVENRPYWIMLDHFPAFTRTMAKVVGELAWMRNTPIYVLTREPVSDDAGYLAGLYWSDWQRLLLGPLPALAARGLLESCIQGFGLSGLDLEGFRQQILRRSGLIPGAIVEMCALAAQPRYQSGPLIKTGLVHIDYLTKRFDSTPRPQELLGGVQLWAKKLT